MAWWILSKILGWFVDEIFNKIHYLNISGRHGVASLTLQVTIGGYLALENYPTLPSRLMLSNFLASTANSMGNKS